MTGNKCFLLIVFILNSLISFSQKSTNYDENLVGEYTLPIPLLINNLKIKNKTDWEKNKSYWIKAFEENVFGFTPKKKVDLKVTKLESKIIQNGQAKREIISLSFPEYPGLKAIEIMVYIPMLKKTKFNLIMGLNYMGNHSVTEETDISINTNWARDGNLVKNNKFGENTRGIQKERWPQKQALESGYIFATAYYGDIEADHNDGWKSGIRSVLGDSSSRCNWGAIGAWAWGMSRILDALEKQYSINHQNVFLTGHSRLGKAALWAAVQDERFTHINANNSGEGGAALFRRNFGENIFNLNTRFTYWFCQKFSDFNNKPENLPIDSHILISLLAPRPVYIGSALDDKWADPKGEFLGLKNAEPVYKLFGIKSDLKFPPLNEPSLGVLSYHIRSGGHDIKLFDWTQYFKFMDLYFRKN